LPYVDLSRGRIYYELAGSGTTILLIHGTGGGAWVWGDSISGLSELGRVLAYDRRGHSRSSAASPGSAMTMTDHAVDAGELLEKLGAAPAVVIGRKRGAAVAVELVRTRPDLVRAVVLAEPSVFGLDVDMDIHLRSLVDHVNEKVRQHGPHVAGEAIVRYVLGDPTWDEMSEPMKELFIANSDVTSAELNSAEVAVDADDLRLVRSPVLCVASRDSSDYLLRTIERLANSVTSGQVCHVESKGMMDIACPCIRTFVRSIPVLPGAESSSP
jgi:pimeloyl-ACP methyl ester carboxylesterase